MDKKQQSQREKWISMITRENGIAMQEKYKRNAREIQEIKILRPQTNEHIAHALYKI